MIKHSNISVFVPHIGCPQRCSFCNQVHITGSREIPSEETVDNAVKEALSSSKYEPSSGELAFFGGSFTAISRDYMLSLLKAAKKHIDNGSVSGIRISTRPDAINEEVLGILKEYGVTAIELGAQSMDDEVLALNKRGHTASDVVKASELIKSQGFSLGLQMMTGLLGDTNDKALKTAERIISCRPETVRIYPTVVLKNTYLGSLFEKGEYKPQSVEEAASLSAKLIPLFEKENIKVIRVGLHSIDEESVLGGAWHPAFGELVSNERYLNIIKEELKNKESGEYSVFVNKNDISKAVGQRRRNIESLKASGYFVKIFGDEAIKPFEVKIKEGER